MCGGCGHDNHPGVKCRWSSGEGCQCVQYFPSITPAEKRIVQAMCAGDDSKKGLAMLLGCSPKTIERHKDRLHKKLGVHSSVGVLVQAVRYGIVGISDFVEKR